MKIDQMTAVFQTLMDTTRLRIVKLLVTVAEQGVSEVCVGDLVISLSEPQYNISKQLKILELAGMLSSRKEGRNVYFSLVKDDGLKGDQVKNKLIEGLCELVSELPRGGADFRKDIKSFDKLLSKPTAAQRNPAAKKELKSPVVTPPRDLGEMDLPSNLL